MKLRTIEIYLITAFVLILSVVGKAQTTTEKNEDKVGSIFPRGELGPDENFTGRAWNIGLVANDTVYNTVVGNVYFEPGAITNWHSHPGGQILIITDGVGYHQIKGQPRHTIKREMLSNVYLM